MLLHKQKSLYHLSDDEKSDLMDMILVTINEVTKFNPNESDGSRYDYGVDFSNMPPINPYVVSNVLQDLGYEEGDVDTNGWENDYWQSFTHPDEKKFPPMQMSGTSWIHECHLHGEEDEDALYQYLEDDEEYADRIKHGLELIGKAMNRADKS